MFVDILFGDFVPDRGGRTWPEEPGYLVDAQGIRPTRNGWRVQAQATLVSGGVAVPSTGNINSAISLGDTINQDFFAGSSTELFQSDDKGASWSDVSGATYSAGNAWDFAVFDDLIIATNNSSVTLPQRKEIGTTTATTFIDLVGMSFSYQTVARVRDHVVLGQRNGSDATSRSVQWSSIGNPEDYPTPGSATALSRQSGLQLMPWEQGIVRKVIGGEKFGIVMQENGMSRMTYIGGNIVYRFDNFNKQVGLGNAGVSGVVQVDDVIYFANGRGVYATNGYDVQKLSDGVLDDALVENNLNHPDASLNSVVSAAHDKLNSQVLFWTNSNDLLGYNYRHNKFFMNTVGKGPVNPSVIFDGIKTVNDNDGVVYSIATDELMYQFDVANSPELQTGFMELVPGRRFQFQGAYLLGADLTTPTISIKVVDDPNNIDLTQGSFTSLTSAARDLKQTLRKTGRFIAFRVTGAQSLAALLAGLRIYYKPVSSE